MDALPAPLGISSATAQPLLAGTWEPAPAHGMGTCTAFLACTLAAARVNSAQSQHLCRLLVLTRRTSCPHKPPGLCAKETPRAIPTLSHSLLWLMFKHPWPDQPSWGLLLFFTSVFPKTGHSGRANAQHQFFMRITPHPYFCATVQEKSTSRKGSPDAQCRGRV